jgi:hypothetical protein
MIQTDSYFWLYLTSSNVFLQNELFRIKLENHSCWFYGDRSSRRKTYGRNNFWPTKHLFSIHNVCLTIFVWYNIYSTKYLTNTNLAHVIFGQNKFGRQNIWLTQFWHTEYLANRIFGWWNICLMPCLFDTIFGWYNICSAQYLSNTILGKHNICHTQICQAQDLADTIFGQ